MVYIEKSLLEDKYHRQGGIAATTCGDDLRSGRTSSHKAMGIIYLLRSLGIRIDSPTILFMDNES